MMKQLLLFSLVLFLSRVAPAQDLFTRHTVHNEDLRILDYVTLDMDGDGDMEIIALHRVEDGTTELVWFENVGGGIFLRARPIFSDFGFDVVVAGDLNGDGEEDLVLSRASWSSGNGLYWTPREGTSVGALLPVTPYNAGPVELVDFDGDGDLDIMRGGMAVEVFLNEGDSDESRFVATGLQAAGPTRVMAPGDYDNDGDVDLLSSNLSFYYNNDTLPLSFQTSEGGPLATSRASNKIGYDPWIPYDLQITDIKAAHFDDNGELDAVVAYYYSSESAGGTLVLIRNVNQSGATNRKMLSRGGPILPGNNNPWTSTDLVVADMDGDGDNDVVHFWVQHTTDVIAWYENPGDFAGDWVEHLVAFPEHGERLGAFDADGDGDLDFLITDRYNLVWYENTGDLGLALEEPDPVGRPNHRFQLESIWPHPATGELNVHLQGVQGAFRVEIIDVLGRTVLTHRFSSPQEQMVLDVTSLASGTYVLRAIEEAYGGTPRSTEQAFVVNR